MIRDFTAILNEEGTRAWGDVFPDNTLPVKSPFESGATLDQGKKQFNTDVYLVDWDALTETQRTAILDKLEKTFIGSRRKDISEQIRLEGLPIQAKYVSTVSIPPRFFI